MQIILQKIHHRPESHLRMSPKHYISNTNLNHTSVELQEQGSDYLLLRNIPRIAITVFESAR